MVSLERLSMFVEYNQIGSITSLGRVHLLRARSNSIRRGSLGSPVKTKNSKTDLLKSAIEITHGKSSTIALKTSNNHINKAVKVSSISRHFSIQLNYQYKLRYVPTDWKSNCQHPYHQSVFELCETQTLLQQLVVYLGTIYKSPVTSLFIILCAVMREASPNDLHFADMPDLSKNWQIHQCSKLSTDLPTL